MIDLKIIIDEYPHSMSARSQLVALLRDLYPSEKRAVNIALTVYDSGIASRIAQLKTIDTIQLHNFIKLLVDEFGLQEQIAVEGIAIWAKAYALSISKGSVDQSPITPQKDTIHNADAYAKPGMVTGALSDYELGQNSQGIFISKFRGFDECDVIIPNNIEGKTIVGIGKWAYLNCKAMKTLIISDGIEFIENGAFGNCENLSSVTFPTTLNRIGSYKQTGGFYTPYSKSNEPSGAFENCGIEQVSLPAGLKRLGEDTFKNCVKLVSVDLPIGITDIENGTFHGCSSLEKMVLPEKLSKIGSYAFDRCSKLSDVQFPLSLREIDIAAFSDCSALVAVLLNEGLRTIGNAVFWNCTNLSKILIPSTVSKIGNQPCKSSDLFTISSWHQPRDRRRNGQRIYSKNSKLTIYCYSGSYALEYARKLEYPIQNAANFSN